MRLSSAGTPSTLIVILSCITGITQLRAIIEPMGMTLTAVPTSKALHLKSAVTALPDGKIIGHVALLDAGHPFHDILPAISDEVSGAHVVNRPLLGPLPQRVVSPHDCDLASMFPDS